jgi:hypothetical protein
LGPFIEDERRKGSTTRTGVESSDRHVRIQQALCKEAQTRRWTDTLSGGCDPQPLAFRRPPDEAASDRHESAVIDIGVNSVKVLATDQTVIRLWNDIRPGLD